MGKSALRLIVKAARIHPVYPRPDKNGIQQPPYLRGAIAVQTSQKLKRFQACVARKLAGQKPGTRARAREAFAAAARECKAEVR